MKYYLIILLTFSSAFSFAQIKNNAEITADFINDKTGELGLRDKIIVVDSNKFGNRVYLFNGIPMDKFFSKKTKDEILKLLGQPNEITTTSKDERKRDYPVYALTYIISKDNFECTSGYANGLPSPLDPNDPENQKSGTTSHVSVGFGYDCSVKPHDKKAKIKILELSIQFYL
jgi:hypothetical protein